MDYSEIRKEVALAHNILIDKDDPVLISVTLNRLVFEKYVKVLTDKNAEFLDEVTSKQEQRDSDARLRMNKMVSDTGRYLEERMSTGLMDATKDVVAMHRKQLGEAWTQIELSRNTIIACTVLTVFCTLATIGVLYLAVT